MSKKAIKLLMELLWHIVFDESPKRRTLYDELEAELKESGALE